MAAQRFDDAHFLAAPPSLLAPQMQLASYASTSASAQAIGTSVLHAGAAPAEAIVNLRLLGKGVVWALAIESATALCIYALWHLYHLWM